jgi:Flp pilus assembly protein TadB
MQINSCAAQEQQSTEHKRKRSSRLLREEIPLKNQSISRSSSVGTIQDEIQDTLHNLLRKQKELEHDQQVTNDWRAMATKIDKILFYVFLFLTIISTLGLLVVAPLFRTNLQKKTKLWNGSRRP